MSRRRKREPNVHSGRQSERNPEVRFRRPRRVRSGGATARREGFPCLGGCRTGVWA
jgi:hypothetical protein